MECKRSSLQVETGCSRLFLMDLIMVESSLTDDDDWIIAYWRWRWRSSLDNSCRKTLSRAHQVGRCQTIEPFGCDETIVTYALSHENNLFGQWLVILVCHVQQFVVLCLAHMTERWRHSTLVVSIWYWNWSFLEVLEVPMCGSRWWWNCGCFLVYQKDPSTHALISCMWICVHRCNGETGILWY